jgi:hypothetical protein
VTNFIDAIAEQVRCTPPVVTDGVFADFANAIVEAHNAEGRDLDALSFVRATAHCSLAQRNAVMLELPFWAQRRITASLEESEAA